MLAKQIFGVLELPFRIIVACLKFRNPKKMLIIFSPWTLREISKDYVDGADAPVVQTHASRHISTCPDRLVRFNHSECPAFQVTP